MKNNTNLVTQISFTFLIFMFFSLVIFPSPAIGQQECPALSTPSVSASAGQALGQLIVSTNLPADPTVISLYYSIGNSGVGSIGSVYSSSSQTTFTVNNLDTNKTYTISATAHHSCDGNTSTASTTATTRDVPDPTITASPGPALGQLTVSTNKPEDGSFNVLYYTSDNISFTHIINVYPWYEQTTFTVNNLDTNKTYTFYADAHAGTRVKRASTRVGGDQDAGGTFCEMKVGHPVNVSNGNMYFMQTDYNLPGVGENINLTRTYNSMIAYSGLFGVSFSTQYDENLIVQNDNNIRLSMSDGRAVYFARTDPNAAFAPVTRGFYGQIVKNADATYTLTFKDGRVHQFGADGRLSWLKDLSGNQTTLNYNQNGQLTGITDSVGRTLTVTLNDFGYVGSVSDALGLVASYTYNSDGTLKTVDYPDGSKYQFTYIAKTVYGVNRSFLTEVRDALGNVLEKHDYDSSGRATTSEKDGGVEKYTLDYSNLGYTVVTDALGGVTKYYYDRSRGRAVTTKIEGDCACNAGGGSQVTEYEYDSQLNLIKKTNGNGQITTFTYDANGNMLTSTDATGTKIFTYNAFGEVLTATDQMNGTTSVTYNSAGNPTQTTDALNNNTGFTYNIRGQILTVTDARNKTTTLTWTGANLTKQTDPDGKETNFVYDARGRIQTVTNALGYITTYQYDLNNRIKKIIYPDAKFEEFTYDLAGRRTNAKDARGNTTTFGYDSAYRLTSLTDALSHTTTFGYDLMSNRTSLTDALNQTTNFEYDSFDRLNKTIYPEITVGGTRLNEQVFYDAVGNIKKRTDTAGRETLFDYDNANRLIKTTDANLQITEFEYNGRSQQTKVSDALNQIYNFTYDSLGRQLSMTRAGSTMSYEYDALGNRTKRTDYIGRQTDYVYDDLNRLTNIDYQGSTDDAVYGYDDLSRLTSAINQNGTVSFTYDNRSRLKTSTDVFAHVVEYGYDENGNRSSLKLDNAVHSTYAYDAANRLTQLTDDASQNFIFGYDNANRLRTKTLPNNVVTGYDYDGMSRLKELKHQSQSTTLFDNNYAYNPAGQINQITELAQTKSFGYDNLDRLTSAAYANPSQSNETYAFDAVGNRTNSGRSATYAYQANNRLISTATGNYGYNANGNMISKTDGLNSWSYVWDYENRMTSATSGTSTAVYKYDALGRRIKRIDPTGSVTKFTYDGMDVVMDDDTITGITKYQNGLGIDDKLKLTNGTDTKYFLQDHLGSTIGLADSSGNQISSASYDSFGNSTNNLTTRYQYTGREKDEFTGLMYYRARWYDGNLGRFISEDPIGFRGGDVNLFAYVKNKSLKYRDPRGLDDADREWENRINPPSPVPNPWYDSHNESADSFGIPNYPGSPMRNPTIGLEGGANFHGIFFGYGGSVGSDYNFATGQLCFYWKWSMRTGLGAFAGAGGKINFGDGRDRQKTGDTTEFEEYNLDLGTGPAAKVGLGNFGSFSSSGNDIGVGIGPGWGGSLGGDYGQRTNFWCSESPCEK